MLYHADRMEWKHHGWTFPSKSIWNISRPTQSSISEKSRRNTICTCTLRPLPDSVCNTNRRRTTEVRCIYTSFRWKVKMRFIFTKANLCQAKTLRRMPRYIAWTYRKKATCLAWLRSFGKIFTLDKPIPQYPPHPVPPFSGGRKSCGHRQKRWLGG